MDQTYQTELGNPLRGESGRQRLVYTGQFGFTLFASQLPYPVPTNPPEYPRYLVAVAQGWLVFEFNYPSGAVINNPITAILVSEDWTLYPFTQSTSPGYPGPLLNCMSNRFVARFALPRRANLDRGLQHDFDLPPENFSTPPFGVFTPDEVVFPVVPGGQLFGDVWVSEAIARMGGQLCP